MEGMCPQVLEEVLRRAGATVLDQGEAPDQGRPLCLGPVRGGEPGKAPAAKARPLLPCWACPL